MNMLLRRELTCRTHRVDSVAETFESCSNGTREEGDDILDPSHVTLHGQPMSVRKTSKSGGRVSVSGIKWRVEVSWPVIHRWGIDPTMRFFHGFSGF